MLWIEPYDLPVVATSVRILAPPSYALRNSLSISSLGFLNCFIGTSPRVDAPTYTQRRKALHHEGEI
jgi:hypothetical protein